MDQENVSQQKSEAEIPNDEQLAEMWTNVTPDHPALRRVHEKLNQSSGGEAAITSYDRMHHRHSRS